MNFCLDYRWFYGKKKKKKKKKTLKIVEGNLYLTVNWLRINNMWYAADNHNNMCHVCGQEFLDLNFI